MGCDRPTASTHTIYIVIIVSHASSTDNLGSLCLISIMCIIVYFILLIFLIIEIIANHCMKFCVDLYCS